MAIAIRIETRKEYELYKKQELLKAGLPESVLAIVLEALLEAFDEGMRHAQGRLEVEVFTL